MKRTPARRRGRNGSIELGPFMEAYRDALYAEMIDEIEKFYAAHPERRQRIRRLTRELLLDLAEGLAE